MKSLVKKIFILIFFISVFLISNGVFAYDDKTTHPALTDEIVDFYNLSYPNNPLTNEEKEWIIQGSIDEDTPPRWINHFYDPIYQNGWSGEKTGMWSSNLIQYFSQFGLSNEKPVSSLDWLNNQTLQAKYGQYKGNRTWGRAIYELAKNKNKKEAYYTLGFILHLIEDATVPDHTRNDTHAHELSWATGDYGSPYEEYLKQEQFKRDNLNLSQGLFSKGEKPIILNSIDDYLISLTQYSNKYFFSKDTINDPKYQFPKIIREDRSFGYGRDENNIEFPLVNIEYRYIRETNEIIHNYYLPINTENSIVLNSYFSRLSRKAILSGAGIIKLFKDEASKAEKENLAEPLKDSASIWSLTGRLYKTTNWVSGQYETLKDYLGSTIVGLSPTNISQNTIQESAITNQNLRAENISQNISSGSSISVPAQQNLPSPNQQNQAALNELSNSNIQNQSILNQQFLNNQSLNSSNSLVNQAPNQNPSSYSAPIMILAAPSTANSSTNTNFNENNNSQSQGQNQESENNQEQNQNNENQNNEESEPQPLQAPTISTNGGEDFITTSSTIMLEGAKPENSEIFINDSNESITYPTSTLWQKEIILNLDENIFIIKAKNNQNESATTSIKITLDNQPPAAINDLAAQEGPKIGQINLSFSRPKDNYTQISKYLIKITDGQTETEQEFLPENLADNEKENYLLENLNPRKIYSFIVFSFDEFGQKSLQSNQASKQPQTKADHLVINQVQIQKKEFIELYNPTNNDLELGNFYFAIYSKNDNWHEPNNLKQFPTDAKISASGYYLIGLYGFSSSTVDWQPYTSYQLSNNDGAVAIFSRNPKENLSSTSTQEQIGQIKIDAFGWGAPKVFETNPKTEIAQDYQSFKREFLAFDTDDNNDNFIISDSSPTNSNNFTYQERVKWALKLNNPDGANDYAYAAVGPDKTIYVYAGYYLFAINPNGVLKWKKKIGLERAIEFYNPTIASDNSIYIGSNNGWLYHFDKDGNEIWKKSINGRLIQNLTLSFDEKRIYLTDASGRLYSINTADGSKNWDFLFGWSGNPHQLIYTKKPAVSVKDERIYVADDFETTYSLYTISPTGTTTQILNLYSYITYPSSFSSAKIDIDEQGVEILYMGSDANLLAIDPVQNKVSWAKSIPEPACPDANPVGWGGGNQPLVPIIGSDSISISTADIWVKANRTIKSFFKNGDVKWFYCLEPEEFVKYATKDVNENIIAVITKPVTGNYWSSRLMSLNKNGQLNWQILKDEGLFKIISAEPLVVDDLVLIVVKDNDNNNQLIALKNNL